MVGWRRSLWSESPFSRTSRRGNRRRRSHRLLAEMLEPRHMLSGLPVPQMLADVAPGGFDSYAEHFTEVGEHVFFSAVAYNDVSSDDAQLWRTDGTPEGTAKILSVEPEGVEHPYIVEMVDADGTLAFIVGNLERIQLWKSDGTVQGTVMVKDFGEGTGYPYEYHPPTLTSVGDRLFAVVCTPDEGCELWVSNLDPADSSGTHLVKDIHPGAEGSYPTGLLEFDGKLYFAADDATHGRELWVSDGTEAGTKMVKDIKGEPVSPMGAADSSSASSPLLNPGSYPTDLTAGDGEFFFGVLDPGPSLDPSTIEDNRLELWRSDGTEVGTQLLHEFPLGTSSPEWPGPQLTYIPETGHLFGVVEFPDGATRSQDLVCWDGAEMLRWNPYPGGDSRVANLSPGDGRLGFAADDGVHGWEPWVSDGTVLGTKMAKDVNPGGEDAIRESAWWTPVAPFLDGFWYFPAFDIQHGTELWRSDGTEEGTSLVADILTGTENSYPVDLTGALGKLFFTAEDDVHGQNPWVLDPAAEEPDPQSATATHSTASGYQTQGGLVQVDNTLTYVGSSPLLSLLWRPGLPTGWTLDSVSGPGSPEIQAGEIVFSGTIPSSPLSFSYQVLVPGDETGTHQIVGQYEYQFADMVNPTTGYAEPDPLLVEPLLHHSADYREPFWVIDGTEVNRVLSYWRAGAYHPNLAGADGYAPGSGATGNSPRHSADYRTPHWLIDGTEVNRVLSYWRAGGYHPNPEGADGYAPGPPPSGEAALGGAFGTSSSFVAPSTTSSATSTHQVSTDEYVPGETLTVYGQTSYEGNLLSLAWFPELPAGWEVVSVSGSGTPELQFGEIVWMGSLPTSPVELEYVVQIPANASGEQVIRNAVQTQFSGQINPTTSYADPDPLIVDSATSFPTAPSDIAGRFVGNGDWWVAESNGVDGFANQRYGRWTTNVTWVDVMVGDFTGSGFDDIVGRVQETGDWWVAVNDGTGNFTSQRWGRWTTSVDWLDVAVGDFDGDGYADLAGRVTSTGDWWVASSDGSKFTNQRWGRWSSGADTWTDVMVGDFDNDGQDDIVGRHVASGDWWVALGSESESAFTNERWGRWTTNVDWLDVVVGDFDGDGYEDVAGRVASTGEWWVAKSTGTGFASQRWGRWSAGADTWTNVLVGDFDNDGQDDIAGRAAASGDWWVAIAKDTGDGFINQRWGRWSPSVSWLDVQVGDFNDDGYADIVGRVASNGDWWVAKSTGTGLANERWGRWAAGANTWVDVLVGNFAPAPAPVADGSEASFAASGEGEPESAALGFFASTVSPSVQYTVLPGPTTAVAPLAGLHDPATVRGDLLDTVMRERPYLRLAADGDPAQVTPTIPAGIRRLVRAGEPVDWESLLDDQAFDPLRLDAYFAALATAHE